VNFSVMNIILALGVLLIAYSFWRAHSKPGFDFNAFDMVMHEGRVDKIAVVFMAVFAVTTWVIVDLQIKDKLTEGYFMSYGGLWVTPLVAKVVFNKTEVKQNDSSATG